MPDENDKGDKEDLQKELRDKVDAVDKRVFGESSKRRFKNSFVSRSKP
jgi:hypothetical protein